MGLFQKFFQPKWQNEDVTVRLEALAELSYEKARSTIEQMAQTDESDLVRRAALAKVTDIPFILDNFFNASPVSVAQAAVKQLWHLATDESSADEAAKIAYITDKADLLFCRFIMEQELSTDIKLAALEKMGLDEQELLQLVKESSNARLRLMAAKDIEAKEALQAIVKQYKGKDKDLYKLAKEKLSAFSEEEKALQAIKEQQEQLCKQFEQLANTDFSNVFGPRFKTLVQQLDGLAQPIEDSLVDRLAKARAACEAVLTEYAEQEAQREAELQKENQLRDAQVGLVDSMEASLASYQSEDAITQDNLVKLDGFVRTLSQSWQELVSEVKPEATLAYRYEKNYELLSNISDSLSVYFQHIEQLETFKSLHIDDVAVKELVQQDKRISSLFNKMEWPSALQKTALYLEAEEVLGKLKTVLQQYRQDEQAKLKTIRSEIKDIQSFITHGKLSDASKQYSKLVGHLKQYPDQLPSEVRKQLKMIQGELAHLKDWQGFAALPKKQELLERMQILAEKKMDLQAKADAVKALQAQWKDLGHTGSDEEKVLWETFREVAEKAYEPCKAFFSNQANVRQQNLEQREKIESQLAYFLAENNWDKPDWAGVEKLVNSVKQEWRKFSPVDRVQGKAIQAKFNDTLKAVQDKLYAHYNEIADQKQLLVDSAQQLVTSQKDIHEVVELAKGLQKQWKEAGRTSHGKENKLWRAFRASMDEIFDKKQQLANQKQEEIDNILSVAEQYISKVQTLTIEGNCAQATSTVEQLKQDFGNIGYLPKDVFKKVQTKFDKAVEGFTKAVRAEERVKQDEKWVALFEKLSICEALEDLADASFSGDKSVDELELQALEEKWENFAQKVPEELSLPLKSRFERTKQLLSEGEKSSWLSSTAQNEQAVQQLCLTGEILTAIDSPAEESDARMKLQVSLLSEGMKADPFNQSTQQKVEELVKEWAQLGPVSHAVRQKYAPRLENIRLEVKK